MTKQLPNFILDPVSELESELGLIERKMREAAARGNESAVVALSARRDELPALIHVEKLRDIGEQINAARTRCGVYDNEMQTASELSRTLGSELDPKVKALELEIERLRSEWAQAQTDRENLTFAAKQARNEFEGLLKQRETLLMQKHSKAA
jgi:chromosome segregation ATPase